MREPLLVLDRELRVIAASRSFYETFQVAREETQGRLLYTLGDGQWDIPALRTLLDEVLPQEWVLEGFEVEHDFPKIGRRIMLLNARTVISEANAHTALLLAIEDISERRETERSCSIFCVRKICCLRRCGIALPTACKSSRASSC